MINLKRLKKSDKINSENESITESIETINETFETLNIQNKNNYDSIIESLKEDSNYDFNRNSRQCKFKGCIKRPSCNFPNYPPLLCNDHKIENMINLRKTFCIEPNCNKTPSCNFPDEKKKLYCSEHKKDGMIFISVKFCEFDGCDKIPIFGLLEDNIKRTCKIHKKDNYVDLKNKKCIQCELKQPNYNLPNEKVGKYCFDCKTDLMIDVKNKKCAENGCNLRPNFNYIHLKSGLYCSNHKKENMVDVVHIKCKEKNCNTQPTYNFENQNIPLYCINHKKENMVDVIHNMCKTPLCNTQVKNKYDGYCLYCFIHLFPHKPISRNYKTKEKTVVDYVLTQFPDFTWICDKVIKGGCSKRRPDLFCDLGYQILIIEIDENQHLPYDCSCENKRIMELSKDVNHRPIIFIRFNPDDYIENNKKINSCWTLNKKGFITISKSKQNEWNKRLNNLKLQIDYWTNVKNQTNKLIEVIQLFYDN
jgi:hypothetical protein